MRQGPRGFARGPSRPDYARLNDIQSRRRAKSRKFVRASIDWIMQDLIPALTDAYSCVIAAARTANTKRSC
jgi:Mg2+ and Co2+ transporter CorA